MLHLPALSTACSGLGFRVSTGGMTPLTNDGGCLGGLCLVGEKPGLGANLFDSAGAAIGLDNRVPADDAARGELCLMGERVGDCGFCGCNIGLDEPATP